MLEFLHDIELQHRDDFDKVVAIKCHGNLTNCSLRFSQMARLQVPLPNVWPTERIRDMGHVVIHQLTNMVTAVQLICELINLIVREVGACLGPAEVKLRFSRHHSRHPPDADLVEAELPTFDG